MIDPYLTEIYQNFQKGVDRDNFLLIILPPLEKFNASLVSPALARNNTKVVASLSDYETLLLQMTSGFMRNIAFVLPLGEFDSSEAGTTSGVWVSSKRVLGEENCYWVDL